MRWLLGPPEGGRYLLFLILLIAQPSEAAVSDYIGKTVAEVRLQIRGAAIQSEELVEIVETRAGAPLTMIEVRESMAHLFGLGLYQDVQVDAMAQGDGVVLTYNLFPAQRVRRIAFVGSLALPENDLRRMIVERHGAPLIRAIATGGVARGPIVSADIPRPKPFARATTIHPTCQWCSASAGPRAHQRHRGRDAARPRAAGAERAQSAATGIRRHRD